MIGWLLKNWRKSRVKPANKNVIYQIVNLVTGMRYIGSAMDFKRRKTWHISQLNNKKHHNKHLENVWHKYGSESFTFEIIDTVPYAEELEDREHYWFSKYNFETELYNKCPVAGSALGHHHTEESKAKMSAANRGEKTICGVKQHPKK